APAAPRDKGRVSTGLQNVPRVRASELVGRGWLNTGGKAVTLADLRGKVVVLDFWTFCCINCLHVLDELREVEEQHREELVIVGVHSPKFEHEADPEALAAAVERYEVRSEEHTSELQSRENLVCRLLLEKKNRQINIDN